MPSYKEFRRPKSSYRQVSALPSIQELYVESRSKGNSHRMAELFAFRTAPALKTATRWIAGHDKTISEHTPEIVRDRLLSAARAAGVSTEGAVYKSQLASYPGDPEAWVSSEEDCKRVADKRNLKLEGGINYTPPGYDDAPDYESPSEYRVADDIVNREFSQLCEEEPEERRRPGAREDLARKLAGEE